MCVVGTAKIFFVNAELVQTTEAFMRIKAPPQVFQCLYD